MMCLTLLILIHMEWMPLALPILDNVMVLKPVILIVRILLTLHNVDIQKT